MLGIAGDLRGVCSDVNYLASTSVRWILDEKSILYAISDIIVKLLMKASYLVQPSSNPLRNRQILLRTSVHMRPTSWYLWTRVQLIVGQRIVGRPGQYGA